MWKSHPGLLFPQDAVSIPGYKTLSLGLFLFLHLKYATLWEENAFREVTKSLQDQDLMTCLQIALVTVSHLLHTILFLFEL
jgi:hypothetical protein